ncbi:MAG: ATP-binding protein [Desulfobulbaceae bacterium]
MTMRGSPLLSFFSHLRLRWKIAILILALHGALGTAFSLVLTHNFTTSIRKELEQRGALITRHLLESVIDPFLLNDIVQLQQLVDKTLSLEDDIAYVFIAAREGLPLVHTFQGGFPKALLTAHEPVREEGISILQLETERGVILDFAAPVLKGQNYFVHVGMSNIHLLRVLDSARGLLFLVMAAFAVIGFVAALIMAAFITRPLAVLAQGVEEIGRGELGKKLSIVGRDELGQLARKFNEMSDNLAMLMAERLRAEQKQRESLSLMEGIANGIGEGILVLDPDFRIFWANTYILEQYGMDLEAIRGKFCYEVTHGKSSPCSPPHDPCPILLEQGAGRPIPLEHIHFDKQGNQCLVEVVVYPLQDENGDIYRYLHISRDITERVEKVKLEDQLRHSQKMEAIGRLSGGMAHDFNNILTAIMGFSELGMVSARESDPLRDKFVSILEASKRGAELTRQLLAFSRKQVVAPQAINLNAIITNFSRMLHRMVGEDVELHLVCRPGIGNIKADPGQIEQVLMNLAVNAREAMPGGGKLTITTDMQSLPYHDLVPQGEDGAGFVRLSVTDTGHGIREEDRKRIFEPFFTTKSQGTGLGLATVYSIVKQHGGVIEVESTPGQGTTFLLYFPEVLEEETLDVPVEAKLTDMPRGTETILIVDDSPELVELLVDILSSLGYRVFGAVSAREAIKVSRSMTGSIDLLLSDVVMPEMNGVELVSILVQERPGLKVIYMSGYADTYLGFAGGTEGAPFLEKPILPTKLARKVREVLDGESSTP